MSDEKYMELIKKYEIKEDKLKNAIIAFLVGGLIGLCGELFIFIIKNIWNLKLKKARMILCISVIFIASLLTALNKFDNYVSKYKMGLILPTTGFAHSMTSSALDYKKDGVISLGSNFFKLSGSVILYGIISAFIFSLLRVILWIL